MTSHNSHTFTHGNFLGVCVSNPIRVIIIPSPHIIQARTLFLLSLILEAKWNNVRGDSQTRRWLPHRARADTAAGSNPAGCQQEWIPPLY
eukprot:COSAG01_NODE_3728_length_5757_cov_7.514493_2_plen_90_part_00